MQLFWPKSVNGQLLACAEFTLANKSNYLVSTAIMDSVLIACNVNLLCCGNTQANKQ